MVRTLIVDHHALTRMGTRALLEGSHRIEIVGEAETAEGALVLARQTKPEVVLLELNVPEMGGLEAVRRLIRQRPVPAVVAVGLHREGPYPACVLEVGATAYLTRDCDAQELEEAVVRACDGERYVSMDVAQHMVLGRLQPRQTPIGSLTPRELAVMVLVSRGHNRSEISDKLSVSPKTVSTYRARLMRKLGASSDVHLTHLSLQHGLIEGQMNW